MLKLPNNIDNHNILKTEGGFLKTKLKALMRFFKHNIFILFAFVSLVLPDLQLRWLVLPKIFQEAFVAPASWCFTAAWVIFIILVCVLLPKKSGRITYIITASLFIILSLCQYIYFKIFDQFFWLKSIALVGEGAEYLSFAVKYIDEWLLSCTLTAVLCLVFASFGWNSFSSKSKKWWFLVLLPIATISALHIFMQPGLHGDSSDDWDSWRKPRVVYKNFNDVNKSLDVCGLYQLTFRDAFNTFIAPDDYGKKQMEKVSQYFEQKPAISKNEYTGLLKGKNVVAVMLEGIDTWMIDQKHTPTISKMMRQGINFTNYYSPFFGTGHTFNAEFAFNTGLFTPISAVSAVNFSANSYPYALPKLFEEAGYSVNSFHYNDSEFYNRGIMHKSFGYEKYHSFTEFGMPETVSQADSNILKSDDIYNKITDGKPFFSFVITYSGHVPYTFDDAKLAVAKENHPELVNPAVDKEKNNCQILAADTDDFFKLLLDRLESDGLLDDTVIIAYTDHYAYGFSDQQKLASFKEGEILYRVPAFIYAKDLPSEKISKPMMTIDWLPTLINLFDLKTDGKYIGNDVLDKNTPGFVYFGNSAWLDEKMYYVPSDAAPKAEDAEHIKSQSARVKESFEINDIIVSGDYYGKR